jgi:hypothetical protein
MRAIVPAGSPYSEEEVLRELRFLRGTRALSFEFEHLNKDHVRLGYLDSVKSFSIDYAAHADIKRTCKFAIKDNTAVNFQTDRIRPWIVLNMPDGGEVRWAQGTFILSTPSRGLLGGTHLTREVEGYDYLQILQDDKITARHTVPRGHRYTDALYSMTSGVLQRITNSTKSLPAAREWEPGTSKLEIINDLLEALNYAGAHFDEGGVFTGRPYQSPNVEPSGYDYRTDQFSVINGDPSQTIDLFAIANKWVLVKSDPDGPPIVGTYTNDNPDSLTSTTSRGRVIVDYRTEEEAADVLTLGDRAERLAFEASQVYESVEFETALMPFHGHADVYRLDIDGLGLDAKFSEQSWSMDLAPGGRMKHTARRIVNL